MKCTWTNPALRQFRIAKGYLIECNPSAVRMVSGKVRQMLSLLEKYPQLGRQGRVAGTRELVITGTSYLIAYEITNAEIRILAFMHGAQRWPENF